MPSEIAEHSVFETLYAKSQHLSHPWNRSGVKYGGGRAGRHPAGPTAVRALSIPPAALRAPWKLHLRRPLGSSLGTRGRRWGTALLEVDLLGFVRPWISTNGPRRRLEICKQCNQASKTGARVLLLATPIKSCVLVMAASTCNTSFATQCNAQSNDAALPIAGRAWARPPGIKLRNSRAVTNDHVGAHQARKLKPACRSGSQLQLVKMAHMVAS